VPVWRVCRTVELCPARLTDYVDDVRQMAQDNRHRAFPVVDDDNHVVGMLSRIHLLKPRRKRVVLVDHNEAAQSVPGLEEAEILEIIDHHRLADIQTAHPIYVRNEPVGSTNTIIASMYRDRGVTPTEGMAGMMAAAILSDTVMFKSPTCTERDKQTAQRMARLANISLEELGKEIFSASAHHRSARELLDTDYKEFHIAGIELRNHVGIGSGVGAHVDAIFGHRHRHANRYFIGWWFFNRGFLIHDWSGRSVRLCGRRCNHFIGWLRGWLRGWRRNDLGSPDRCLQRIVTAVVVIGQLQCPEPEQRNHQQ
jgi:hypothetical protein